MLTELEAHGFFTQESNSCVTLTGTVEAGQVSVPLHAVCSSFLVAWWSWVVRLQETQAEAARLLVS